MYMFIVTAMIVFSGYSMQAAEHRCEPPVEQRIMTETDHYDHIRARINAMQQELLTDAQHYGKQEVCDCCGCSVTRDHVGCASTLITAGVTMFTAIYCNLPSIYSAAVAGGVAKTVNDCFKPDQEAKKATLNRLRDELYS